MKYLVAMAAALFFTWVAVLVFPFTWRVAFCVGTFGVTWTMLLGCGIMVACYKAVA
jgi:hypothetical protein